MKALIAFLLRVDQILAIAETTLFTFDSNDTGIDDESARFIGNIRKNIKAFIGANSDVNAPVIAQGYTATLAFCNAVLASIDLVAQSALPKDEKVSKIKALISDLSDPNKVYPAKKGSDAEVLSQTKLKAAEKLAKIENS